MLATITSTSVLRRLMISTAIAERVGARLRLHRAALQVPVHATATSLSARGRTPRAVLLERVSSEMF